jgi:hypothetical protein
MTTGACYRGRTLVGDSAVANCLHKYVTFETMTLHPSFLEERVMMTSVSSNIAEE